MTDYREPADVARQLVGNYKTWRDFSIGQPIDDQDCIVYTRGRDSHILTLSNAEAIQKRLQPYIDADKPDIQEYNANHWASGWLSGYIIRVYTPEKEPTEVFTVWCDIQYELSRYPVLNEDDYTERKFQKTLEYLCNILLFRHGIDDPDEAQAKAEAIYGSFDETPDDLEQAVAAYLRSEIGTEGKPC